MLVKVDPDEHPKNTQNVHFNVESEDEFDQDKVDGEGRVDAGVIVRRENALNGALRCHDVKNFSEYPAKEPSNQHEDDQNPRRFSHAAALLSLCVSVQWFFVAEWHHIRRFSACQ